MASTKPYLIRAIYDWCADEGFTPYLVVQVDERTQVPSEFVRDGQIVLNVSPDATHQMSMGNDEITFQTRFGGKAFPVIVPVSRVSAIYARENGQGMAFEAESIEAGGGSDIRIETGERLVEAAAPPADELEAPARRGSHLTRIK